MGIVEGDGGGILNRPVGGRWLKSLALVRGVRKREATERFSRAGNGPGELRVQIPFLKANLEVKT